MLSCLSKIRLRLQLSLSLYEREREANMSQLVTAKGGEGNMSQLQRIANVFVLPTFSYGSPSHLSLKIHKNKRIMIVKKTHVRYPAHYHSLKWITQSWERDPPTTYCPLTSFPQKFHTSFYLSRLSSIPPSPPSIPPPD